MRHDSFIWDMTHLCKIWLIHMRHDSFIWDMTHSYKTWLTHMRHDSFIRDMAHSYETWLIHMRHGSFIWDMTHWYETWFIDTHRTSFTWGMSRTNETCHEGPCKMDLNSSRVSLDVNWSYWIQHSVNLRDLNSHVSQDVNAHSSFVIEVREGRTWMHMFRYTIHDSFIGNTTPSLRHVTYGWVMSLKGLERTCFAIWDMTPSSETRLLHTRHVTARLE